MAESVEFRKEESIPELEELLKTRLFDESEIKAVAKRRQEFEYRLHRHTKNKDDCIRYIQYEFSFLKLIRARRMKGGVFQKKLQAEYNTANRLNRLFIEILRRYSDDICIWLIYLKFCQHMRFFASASRMFNSFLHLHGQAKPKLYTLASKWELEECKSIENARKVLLTGLRVHKDSQALYKEAFKIELHYANELRNEAKQKKTADLSEPVLLGAHAKVIYKSAVKKMNSPSFILELLKIAKEYDFTQGIQDTILTDMKTMFPRDELTGDAIAKNKLTDTKSKQPLQERIRECAEVYRMYTKKLKTRKIWSMYIDTMQELYKDRTTIPKLKRQLLLRALNSGHKNEKLEEKHYIAWFDLLKGIPTREKKLASILQIATERLSSCETLWETRMQFHMHRGEIDLVEIAFKEATESLGPKILNLWKLMLLYYQTSCPSKLEEFYKDGIKSRFPELSCPVKLMYLEWLVLAKGIGFARRFYKELLVRDLATKDSFGKQLISNEVIANYAIPLDMHSKMMNMEVLQPDLNVKNAQRCLLHACNMYGENNADVWISAIEFMKKHGENKHISNMHQKAMKVLDSKSLRDSYESEIVLLDPEISSVSVVESSK